jgi:2-keto-4-pentenoate hydratase/2-oxohepta-3-ene-1,7-dioic acid hydratase in catechol pathway
VRIAAVSVESPRGAWAIGVVSADLASIRVLDASLGTVDDVVRGVVTLAQIEQAVVSVASVDLTEVVLGPPVQRFNRDVLCTGWNYVDHFHESTGKREGQDPEAMPEHPTFFTKGPDTVVGPHDAVAFDPAISQKWDYEAEIAIVIGKGGRSIDEIDAWNHVFGFCLANDISQRDLQRAHGGQWLKGKSIDQTMPLGPWITTADEVENVDDLYIGCELNGVTMQRATAGEMAFSIPRIIAELSFGMTLRTGDLVLTGTPSGIGNAREPAVFLAAGDIVVTRGGILGDLSNAVTVTPLT